MNEIEKFFDKVKKEQPERLYNELKNAWDKQKSNEKLKDSPANIQKCCVGYFALGYSTAKIENCIVKIENLTDKLKKRFEGD